MCKTFLDALAHLVDAHHQLGLVLDTLTELGIEERLVFEQQRAVGLEEKIWAILRRAISSTRSTGTCTTHFGGVLAIIAGYADYLQDVLFVWPQAADTYCIDRIVPDFGAENAGKDTVV